MKIGTIIDIKKEIGVTYDFGSELLELVKEYPDYPITVICGVEVCDGDYSVYAPKVSCKVEEILTCRTPWWNRDEICCDKESFEEEVYDDIYWHLKDKLNREPTEEECDVAMKEVLAAHEPYWTKVIAIYADS